MHEHNGHRKTHNGTRRPNRRGGRNHQRRPERGNETPAYPVRNRGEEVDGNVYDGTIMRERRLAAPTRGWLRLCATG